MTSSSPSPSSASSSSALFPVPPSPIPFRGVAPLPAFGVHVWPAARVRMHRGCHCPVTAKSTQRAWPPHRTWLHRSGCTAVGDAVGLADGVAVGAGMPPPHVDVLRTLNPQNGVAVCAQPAETALPAHPHPLPYEEASL